MEESEIIDVNKATRNWSIVGIISIIIIVLFFKDNDKTLPNYATVIGTICSVIGLIIAYINIRALKKASELMSKKIDLSLQKVHQINAVSEISKAIKVNQEIQNFIRNNKIELAHLRFLDLKYMLSHFNTNQHLSSLTSDNNYSKLVMEFGINLNSINELLINSKRKVDFAKVTNDLEELTSFLTQFETKIKSLNL